MSIAVEDIQRKIEKSSNTGTALYIAALAALLALCSMLSDDASKAALSAHIEASNQFAFFQAKNIRLTSYTLAADEMEIAHPAARDKITAYRKKAATYVSEKKETLAAAREEQGKRKMALVQARYYDYAITLLQIAIVIASASIISGGAILLTLSFLAASGAGLLAANGYTLLYEIPILL